MPSFWKICSGKLFSVWFCTHTFQSCRLNGSRFGNSTILIFGFAPIFNIKCRNSIHSEKRIRVADGLTKTIKKERWILHAVNLLWCLVTILPSSFTSCCTEGEEKVTHHHLNLSTEIETCCVHVRPKITLKETLLFDVVTSHGNNILFPIFWIANYTSNISGNH